MIAGDREGAGAAVEARVAELADLVARAHPFWSGKARGLHVCIAKDIIAAGWVPQSEVAERWADEWDVRPLIQERLARAWDEGYERRAATLGMTADPNPYRPAGGAS